MFQQFGRVYIEAFKLISVTILRTNLQHIGQTKAIDANPKNVLELLFRLCTCVCPF